MWVWVRARARIRVRVRVRGRVRVRDRVRVRNRVGADVTETDGPYHLASRQVCMYACMHVRMYAWPNREILT